MKEEKKIGDPPISTVHVSLLHSNFRLDSSGDHFLRGSSQTSHFSVALAGFCNMHVLHVHDAPLVAVGSGFRPAAAQSNAFTGAEGISGAFVAGAAVDEGCTFFSP